MEQGRTANMILHLPDLLQKKSVLSCGQSTDNLTPQSLIKYEMYLNEVLDHTLVGRGQIIHYGTAA